MPTFPTQDFSLHILEIINFTQNHALRPKEYRGEKIKVKNRATPKFGVRILGFSSV